MKTKLHTYSFNLDKVEDREPYHQLNARLTAEIKAGTRGHKMHAWDPSQSNKRHELTAGEITLEPEFLFENQWNADAGRVFDWYEEYMADSTRQRLIKRGHWLEMTPEMVAIRRNTLKCGYTGKQFPADCGKVFNETPEALGSPYLKESELHLLRLFPVADEHRRQREPLTEAERAYLLPLYIAAQTSRKDAVKPDLVAAINRNYETAESNARAERDGKLWLLERGVPLENVIYYTHTGKFSFGWRTPYGVESHAALLAALEGFPFPYEIKGEPTGHGKTTVGTSYFPTRSNAVRYYREQGFEDPSGYVETSLKDGAIHIGKPPMKPGQTLSISDCRYHVTG